MLKRILISGLLFIPFTFWGQETEKALAIEIGYTGDHVQNLRGGIKTGYAYLGILNLQVTLNTQDAGWWKGGAFSVLAVNTHGATPSTELIGDAQVTSNIEAGNHTYLQELWLKQTFGKIDLTLGLQDLNATFACSDYGSLFLNSSFGITPVISGNINAPLFPLTSLGLTANWQLSEKTNWVNALYDGSPTDFDYNPYNLKWSFATGDGLLYVSEWQHTSTLKDQPGTYKLGVYTHNHWLESPFRKQLPDSLKHSITGFYTNIDQKVWQKERQSLGVFLQSSYSPSLTSSNKFHFGIGLQASGFISRKGEDILGLALAHDKFSTDLGSETAIELTWQKTVFNHISLQPDLQYIINPSGNQSNLKNSLSAIIRLQIHL